MNEHTQIKKKGGGANREATISKTYVQQVCAMTGILSLSLYLSQYTERERLDRGSRR